MATETQVFVAQASGKKAYRDIGIYVWQMIWLVFSIQVLIWFASLFLTPLLFQTETERQAIPFFRIMLSLIALFPITTALSAFYSGRGKVILVSTCTIIKSILSASLTYILIFGAFGIPSFGLIGAALGPLIAEVLHCITLFFLFLQKKYRSQFGTHLFLPNTPFMSKVLRIGFLSGVSSCIISFAWFFIVKIVSSQGAEYITVMAFGNVICTNLIFVNIGLGQSLTTVISAFMGAQKNIGKPIRSILILFASFLAIIAIPLLFFPRQIVKFYYTSNYHTFSPELIQALILSCRLLFVFQVVAILDRIMRCLLTASGDTVFMFWNFTITQTLFSCGIAYVAIPRIPMSMFWAIIVTTILIRDIPPLFRVAEKRWERQNLVLCQSRVKN